jgi:hypothetical protein
VQKVPWWVLRGAKEQPIRSGEQEKTSDEGDSSGSDFDGDIINLIKVVAFSSSLIWKCVWNEKLCLFVYRFP